MTGQILWGSTLLGLCALIHLVFIVWWVGVLRNHSKVTTDGFVHGLFVPIAGTFALLVFSHTVQIWIWAGVLVLRGALPDLFQAIYFSLVTYTTLGYGDVVLGDQHKVFGSMASITGLLNFGVSTAFLVAVLGKVLPNHLGED